MKHLFVILVSAAAIYGCGSSAGSVSGNGENAQPVVAAREVPGTLSPVDFLVEEDTSAITISPPRGYRTQISTATAVTTISGTQMSIIIASPQGSQATRIIPMQLNEADGTFEARLDTNWIVPPAHDVLLEIYDPVAGTPAKGHLVLKGRHLPK